MSSAGGTGRVRERLRSLPDRTPLRLKMITAVLALVIIALAVISFTTIAVFRSYLRHQAGDQVTKIYNEVSAALESTPGSGPVYPAFLNYGQYVVEMLNSSGQQIRLGQHAALVPFGSGPVVPTSTAWLSTNAGRLVTVGGQTAGDNWLVITQRVSGLPVYNPATGQVSNVTATLVVGADLGNINQTIGYLTDIDLLVSGVVVVVIAIVGIALVRASLQPLTDIEQTAAAIAAGDLSSRVPDRDPRTEVGRLGRSLNAMLAQIETAFRDRTESEEAARRSEWQMRQFLADASHELRTPLTAIRGFAEYYRQRGGLAEIPGAPRRRALDNGGNGADRAGVAPRDSLPSSDDAAVSPGRSNAAAADGGSLARADLDRIMQRVEQESSRMGVLVEDMLLLARLDQQRPLEQRTVDMLTLAADAVHDARVVAPDRNIGLTVGAGAALLVIGDEVRLRQVIGNLMSNALNHTPDGTPIEVRVRSGTLDEWRQAAAGAGQAAAGAGQAAASAGQAALVAASREVHPFPAVILEVADQGPGLTPHQAEHVFERFYRADQARTRKAGGAGLGLAIVAALVAAHGGTVWVESPPGGGATFRIAIPLAPEARHSGPDPDDGTDPDILDSHGALATGPAVHAHHPTRRPPGGPPRPPAPAAAPPGPHDAPADPPGTSPMNVDLDHF